MSTHTRSRAAPGRLPAPPEDAQALMAAHAEKHALAFELEEHVHLEGTRRPEQIFAWNADNATFVCELCPGLVFQTGDITPTMIRRAQLFDPSLQPHLVGLHDRADRDEMALHYLRGDLNQAQLRQLRRASGRRRAVAGRRPVVEEGHRRVQEWMLKQRARLPSGRAVLDAAMELQVTDEDAWIQIAFRGYARETLRKQWQAIDEAKKLAAAEAFERRKRRRT